MRPRKNQFILLVVGILLVLFSWSYLIPKFNQTLEAREKLEVERERLARLKNKVSQLQGLNEYELSNRTKLTLEAVPAEKNFLDVLGIISQTATERNLMVKSFRVSPGPMAVKEKGKLTIKLGMEGDIDDLSNFLVELEKVLPLITPTSNKLVVKFPSTNTTSDLSVEFSFQPLPKTLGKIDSVVPKLTDQEEKFLNIISSYTALPEEVIPPSTGRANPFSF